MTGIIGRRIKIFHGEGANSSRAFEEMLKWVNKVCGVLVSVARDVLVYKFQDIASRYDNPVGVTIVVDLETKEIGYAFCSSLDTYVKEYGRLKAVNQLCDKIPDAKGKRRVFIGNYLYLLGPEESPIVPMNSIKKVMSSDENHMKDIRHRLRELDNKLGYTKACKKKIEVLKVEVEV